MCIIVFPQFVSLPLLLMSDHQWYLLVCVSNLLSCWPEKNTLQSLIHDDHIIVNCYAINGTVFWFVLSFWLNQLQLFFPNLYNQNIKHYTITRELVHIKWITNNDERNNSFWCLRVTNSSYITLTEDIKIYFLTLSNKNKTVNTAVYNKYSYKSFSNCYVLQPRSVTDRQEIFN